MATAYHEPVFRAPIDLARLNDAERRVLRLLAEGHTAKSIAVALGSTPAAVNERLREARRKTGVGSSRELARLLKSLENRDDELGVVLNRSSAAGGDHAAPSVGRSRSRRMLVMLILAVGALAAAGLAMQLSGGEHAAPLVDPLLGPIPSSQDAPDAMYKNLRAEPRDSAWAPGAERLLSKRFSQIAHVGSPPAVLRVTCATTVCEVAGTIDAPEPKGKEYDDPNHPLVKATRELQEPPLRNDLEKAGLKQGAGMFGASADKPQRAAFIIYYTRTR